MPSIGMMVAVASGGAIGTLARYLTLITFKPLLGKFPIETIIVNFFGCFLMGLLIELFSLKLNVSQELKTFLTVGILGGYTTFSSFALDVASLSEKNQFFDAFIYALLSISLALLGFFTAMYGLRFFFKA